MHLLSQTTGCGVLSSLLAGRCHCGPWRPGEAGPSNTEVTKISEDREVSTELSAGLRGVEQGHEIIVLVLPQAFTSSQGFERADQLQKNTVVKEVVPCCEAANTFRLNARRGRAPQALTMQRQARRHFSRQEATTRRVR